MMTFMRNALWARRPWSGAKIVDGLDDVCDRPRKFRQKFWNFSFSKFAQKSVGDSIIPQIDLD